MLQHFSDDGLCVPGAAALGVNKHTLGRSLKVSTGEVFSSSAAKPRREIPSRDPVPLVPVNIYSSSAPKPVLPWRILTLFKFCLERLCDFFLLLCKLEFQLRSTPGLILIVRIKALY